MIEAEPALVQESEGISARAIWLIAAGVVAVSALLVAIAWLLVVPPAAPARAAGARSPLEHGLVDQATGGDDIRAAGERRLERTEWIDRSARVVRIPIDRAIDAVVADPKLIGAAAPGLAGGAGGTTVGAAGGAAPEGAR
jgi:hypothetical protein